MPRSNKDFCYMVECKIKTSLFLVDCQWEAWAAWSSCADDCSAADGTGKQDRTRTSKSNTPANGGEACNSSDESGDQSCSEECPGKHL